MKRSVKCCVQHFVFCQHSPTEIPKLSCFRSWGLFDRPGKVVEDVCLGLLVLWQLANYLSLVVLLINADFHRKTSGKLPSCNFVGIFLAKIICKIGYTLIKVLTCFRVHCFVQLFSLIELHLVRDPEPCVRQAAANLARSLLIPVVRESGLPVWLPPDLLRDLNRLLSGRVCAERDPGVREQIEAALGQLDLCVRSSLFRTPDTPQSLVKEIRVLRPFLEWEKLRQHSNYSTISMIVSHFITYSRALKVFTCEPSFKRRQTKKNLFLRSIHTNSTVNLRFCALPVL